MLKQLQRTGSNNPFDFNVEDKDYKEIHESELAKTEKFSFTQLHLRGKVCEQKLSVAKEKHQTICQEIRKLMMKLVFYSIYSIFYSLLFSTSFSFFFFRMC